MYSDSTRTYEALKNEFKIIHNRHVFSNNYYVEARTNVNIYVLIFIQCLR
jgi:hypothetical protein